jgi:hypothetical protein
MYDEEAFKKFCIVAGYISSPFGILLFVHVLIRDFATTDNETLFFTIGIITFLLILFVLFHRYIKRQGWLWYK